MVLSKNILHIPPISFQGYISDAFAEMLSYTKILVSVFQDSLRLTTKV